MQTQENPFSHKARSARTRKDLIDAAALLFARTAYDRITTPEIVANAGVSRGALYHHFADKREIFAAVVERESAEVAAQIQAATTKSESALDAFVRGADAYFAAIASAPGRARILLIEGPAVLGAEAMQEIDRKTGQGTLREGLVHAIEQGEMRPLPIDATADLLSAAFDRAALAIASGEQAHEYRDAIRSLLEGLLNRPR